MAATAIVTTVAPDAWTRLSAGEGAQGPRWYDWTRIAIRPLRERGGEHGLLVRRSLTEAASLAYYVCFAPTGTPLAELVRVVGQRWAIECCFAEAKGEVGLDQYEVRTWPGW